MMRKSSTGARPGVHLVAPAFFADRMGRRAGRQVNRSGCGGSGAGAGRQRAFQIGVAVQQKQIESGDRGGVAAASRALCAALGPSLSSFWAVSGVSAEAGRRGCQERARSCSTPIVHHEH